MAKKKAAKKATKKETAISPPKEDLVKVKVLQDFPGRKKGETYLAPARKLSPKSREVKKGWIGKA